MGLSGREALALPVDLDLDGRRYQFAPVDTIEVVAAYECYLEDQAWAVLERARARKRPVEDLQAMADGIRRDLVAGVFTFGARHWVESLQSVANQKELLYLCATHCDRDFDRAVLDRLYRFPDKVADLTMRLFAGVLDPNRPAPPAPA